ncbi:MAG: ribosome biogenesis GTPase Der [Magnetospiraceae bacterium]
MSLTVAIVGRPNVGKSTLFNRLVGKRLAIVDDTPGVTRDRREGEGAIAELRFRVFDTAGLEDVFDNSLESRMRAQTERAVADADVVLFLIDARAGLTPVDKHFADWLRGLSVPVHIVANKCEGKAGEPGRLEAYELGLGDPLPISAEHGEGMAHLYDVLAPLVEDRQMGAEALAAAEEWARQARSIAVDEAGAAIEEEAADASNAPLQLAIVGRPNVGKSTLINRLIGEDRLLTGPEAGITRDSIGVEWIYKDRPIRLIDTAGLRRKAKITQKLEGLSAADTLRAIRYAQVVALVLDAVLEKQDLTIARHVIDEGRAPLIVVNKWDAAQDRQATLARLKDRLQTSLPQVKGIPIVTLSALTGSGVDKLLPTALKAYQVWNRRVSTSKLNGWLSEMLELHPPPLVKGRRVRIRYMTQAKTRPPTFVLFASQAQGLPESYLRYVSNGLREDFKLPGIPLRLLVRKGQNPYAKDR